VGNHFNEAADALAGEAARAVAAGASTSPAAAAVPTAAPIPTADATADDGVATLF